MNDYPYGGAQHAVDEMREFHYLEFWHPRMKKYMYGLPERLAHSSQLAAYRHLVPHAGARSSLRREKER